MSAKSANAHPGARTRAVRLALAYFAVATAMLVWPVFPLLGNHVEPRLFGLPWSMTYVLGIVVCNFGVLVWLYRRRLIDEPEDESARAIEVSRSGG